MPARKQYASADTYERKLHRVMERFEVQTYDYNWDRFGCWIQFRYKGELYRFEHSIDKAQAAGHKINYGSDTFAQLVLALEDLARITERGIYDLQNWVVGMRFLPPPVEVPSFFRYLGFTEIPAGRNEVRDRYRTLAKQMHPDNGGSVEDFRHLKEAAEKAIGYFVEGETE